MRRGVFWVCLAIGAGCAGDDGGGGGGGGNRFTLDYKGGPEMLLDLRVTAALTFSGDAAAVPGLKTIGVAQAHAMVFGNGQQTIELKMSSSLTSLEVGDRFLVSLDFGRANQGAALDAGGTVSGVACAIVWSFANDDTFGTTGECALKRSGGGYTITVEHAIVNDKTQIAGTVTFGPVPNAVTAFTPGNGCSADTSCLSLDPSMFEPETGFCLPTTNLKSQSAPCSASCGTQLQVNVGGSQHCVCTYACGRLATGGGGDPPVCDPAYGCIDI